MAVVDAPSRFSPLPARVPASATPPSTTQGGFSFGDLLDIVNPLQHIPIVSTIYRAVTGDEIKPFDRVAGDTLYGGVIGFVSSMADTVFEAITGRDFGDTVLAFLTGKDGASDTAVAKAAAPASLAQTQTAEAFPQATVTPEATIAAPDLQALFVSMSRNGVDPALATRAARAYSRAVMLSVQPLS